MKLTKIIFSLAIIFSFLIFITFIQESTAQSQSSVGTLSVEKDTYAISYSDKVQVKIFGNVKSQIGSQMVTISIIDPDDNSDGTKIVPSSNGDFEYIIDFDKTSLKGTYTVMASYMGKSFDKISFVVKDKQPTIEDILKARGERITAIEKPSVEKPSVEKPSTVAPIPTENESIPKDEPVVDNQKNIPYFVDPLKDPQYYLDRYYNEEKYKEWFDKNFPDYTIEEAVGFKPKTKVPEWVKNISLWFGEGKITENEFLDSVAFLIKNNIMKSDKQEQYQDKGNFKVVYETTKNPNYIKIQNKLKQTQFFEEKSKDLNSKLNLPNDIIINLKECKTINAFYDGDSKKIIICYEMYEYLRTLFSSAQDDEQVILGSIDGAMEFFFLHELGHALIDAYDIPITGMEEDAVDQLATVILLQKGNDGLSALVATAGFFGVHGMAISDIDELAFSDEHSLDMQRFYNILCFTYGSNVSEYRVLIDLKILPKDRSIQCMDEYSKISKSWNLLLSPYEKSTSLIRG